MAKNLKKRYVLCKNGRLVNSYLSFGRALIGIESFYNRGEVLPDDNFKIFDRKLNIFIYDK